MNQRIIKVIAVCAVLAVAFTASACHRYRTPEDRAERMSNKIIKELDLDDAQQAKLRAAKEEFLTARAQVHTQHQAMFDEVLAEVQSDRLDEAKLMQLFEKRQGAVSQVAPRVLAKIAEFHASLTPKQKAEAAEHLQKFRDHMSRHEGGS